ncbi:RNA-binding protein 4B-like [Carcharodon carcharias]|uniref:RNA-binding protein 4B-like n=1 Tax=Carcharodon carcharias TaxID=13397 RepID=UPI001B7ED23A|nr:RNA-binding protein 4B-like [Carcharodon carcharias]
MVKIFVGNLSRYCSPSELRSMFEKYGEVSECEVVRNYAFVHMEKLSQATRAIKALHRSNVHGAHITVGVANARTRNTTKVFVGNLAEPVSGAAVKELFQRFGRVVDLDVARTFAFVYMEQERQALAAIQALDGTPLQGQNMFVQLSRSNPSRETWALGGQEAPPPPPPPATPPYHQHHHHHQQQQPLSRGPLGPPHFAALGAYYDQPAGCEPYRQPARGRPFGAGVGGAPPPSAYQDHRRPPPGMMRPMPPPPPQYFRAPYVNGYGSRVRGY